MNKLHTLFILKYNNKVHAFKDKKTRKKMLDNVTMMVKQE